MWNYSEKLKEHFLNPRNVGEMENPDAVGEIGSLACGDALKLMLKIDEDERIVDAKFQTFGCASAIASASALTELIKGKSVSEAANITNRDIVEYLEGMPREKMHCSVMGREALEAAIADYRGEGARLEEEGKVVCTCFGVAQKEIERVVRENGLTTVEEVTNYTKAGGGCGSCRPEIQGIINHIRGQVAEIPEAASKKKKLTNVQRIKLIEQALEREIRPMLQQDGGDIELVDVDKNVVTVAMRGMCANCPSAEFTMEEYIQSKLRDLVDPEIVLKEAEE